MRLLLPAHKGHVHMRVPKRDILRWRVVYVYRSVKEGKEDQRALNQSATRREMVPGTVSLPQSS